MKLLVLLAGFTTAIWGCSCAESGAPACQEAWKSSAVFRGFVVGISQVQVPDTRMPRGFWNKLSVRFDVRGAFTGLTKDTQEMEVLTGLGGGDCGYRFERGQEYVVYAYRNPDGKLETGICSRTRPVSEAKEDLDYFESVAKGSAPTELRVIALDVFNRDYPHAGLPGVKVTIQSAAGQQSATTDDSGEHTFTKISAGAYQVHASLQGYTAPSGAGMPAVNVHTNGCALVRVGMQIDRRIAGQLLSKDGRPAAGVTVEVVRHHPEHENEMPFPIDSVQTDENGRYELRRVPAGDYYLGINLNASPSLQVPYSRWFYPGTDDPQLAGIIHVGDRPETQRFDFSTPEKRQERVVMGKVFRPNGEPVAGAHLFVEDARWPSRPINVGAVATDAQGQFQLRVFDGTRYRLHATAGARFAGDTIAAEPTAIEPGSEPLKVQVILSLTKFSRTLPVGDELEHWRKGLGLSRVP